MKIRIQLTREISAAILCAAGWFLFWLLAFRPAPSGPVLRPSRPEFIRLTVDNQTLRKLKAPTLFALPSIEGFSGKFLEDRVDIPLTLEKPADPVRYLSKESTATPGVNQTLLMGETALSPSALPLPGSAPRVITPSSAGTQLFLSSELQERAGKLPALTISADGLPDSVRVHLVIRSDGTVEQTFFDTPVTNAALLGAVRGLRFNPAEEKAEGWIDLRFPQKGGQ